MDTRSNHNMLHEEPDGKGEHDEARLRTGKGKRVNKPLGLLIIVSAVFFLTMGLLSVAVLNNANRPGLYISGIYNTNIYFHYPVNGWDFSRAVAQRYDKLYTVLTERATTAVETAVDTSFDTGAVEEPGLPGGVTYEQAMEDLRAQIRDQVSDQVYEQILEAFSSAGYDVADALVKDELTAFLENYTPETNISSYLTGSTMVDYTIEWPDNAYAIWNTDSAAVRDELRLMRDFKFIVYGANGEVVFTNIAGVEDELVRLREGSLLAFSLTNPPEDLVRYGSEYDNYDMSSQVETLRSRGLSGVVFIPYEVKNVESELLWALRANDDYQLQINGLRNEWCPIFFTAFAAIMAVGLLFFRSSMISALALLYGWYSKQPLLVKLPLSLISALLLIITASTTGAQYLYWNGFAFLWFDLPFPVYVVSALYLLLSMIFLVVLAKGGRRALRSEPDIRFLARLVGDTRITLKTRQPLLIVFLLAAWLLTLAMVFTFLFGGLYIFLEEPDAGLLIILLTGVGFFVCGAFMSLIFTHARMTFYTSEIASGLYREYPPHTGWFKHPLNNLSRINDGMHKAVDEAVRSERLKSELVTNVSHDLKTPLTSIINYVALLKETPVAQTKNAAEYLDVIDKKTQRLRVLIDDLFEAAKLNSGSVILQPEEVNIVDLLKQALGELNEKIDESGVRFICNFENERITRWLDGKKLWRVFENLIGNIIKYAPSGSRAYISAVETDGTAVLTFKNVSNYAMDFESEELFERFKRGDASRSTEGSGLGLSIARGIVEQSGGRMHVTTDGDLFKAVIEFPS